MQTNAARPDFGFFRKTAAKGGRSSGLWRRSLLSWTDRIAGPRRKIDLTEMRQTFRQAPETDTADAEAICEAAQPTTLRAVPVKSEASQTSAVVFWVHSTPPRSVSH